jgi:polysaccharide biosynthesis transport protein
VIAGLRSSNIALVDSAHVPARPAKPNVMIYAAGGIAGALVLGILAALFREATDHRVYDIGKTKAALRWGPLIAFVPNHRTLLNRKRLVKQMQRRQEKILSVSNRTVAPSVELVAQLEPHSSFTEAMRSLRTAVENTTLCQSAPRSILITSSVPGEGKTSLSINLAAVHAQGGRRVLLIDSDLRTPTLGKRLGVNDEKGLSSLLQGDVSSPEDVIVRIPLDGRAVLDVMPAGPVPGYPTELLASDEMARLLERCREEYDYVILDSAPLLPVTDSAQLSKLVDFTLIVARHNMTDLRSLERTSELLQAHGVYTAGVVLNGIKVKDAALFRHYGYRQTAYYGGRLSA